MQSAEEIKSLVREKYAEIARQSREQNAASCCGAGGCSTIDYAVFAQDYSQLDGYIASADLGLGCGVPTEFARIKPGDIILDLGSGAGNDCFVARSITGEKGKVIGVDMTPAMIEKARDNAEKLGFNNVEFRQGEIEHLPIGPARVDVIISNCVLNLVPDKAKAFSEMYRVLKPGGHFSVSDIVIQGILPQALLQAAEMYAGCVAGAIPMDEYLALISVAGFTDITVQKMKKIDLPDDILSEYMDADQIREFRDSQNNIVSITVFGAKPEQKEVSCCAPGSDCC
jgi:SAM-dependent methyltransferase